MTTLITLPDRNSPGERDYIFAFLPDAQALEARRADSQVVKIDLSKPKAQRQRQLLAAIEQYQPDSWVWFGHGLRTSLPQLGIDTPAEIAALAAALAANTTAPVVALYSCSTAGGAEGGDGHLADLVRDAIVKCGAPGVRLFAHDRKGDTSRNPYVKVFAGPEEKPLNVGGKFVVQPGSLLWARWRCCDNHQSHHCPRKGVHGPLRLDFPWLTSAEIEARLEEEYAR